MIQLKKHEPRLIEVVYQNPGGGGWEGGVMHVLYISGRKQEFIPSPSIMMGPAAHKTELLRSHSTGNNTN